MVVFIVAAIFIFLPCRELLVDAKRNATVMNDKEITHMMKQMLTNYETKIRPNYTGAPLDVVVDASVMSFGKLDTLNMAFTLDMFFRQTWNDHRLRHNLSRILTLTCGTKHPADFIWVPDTVFINAMKSTMHSVTVNNHKLDINQNGQVFWGTSDNVLTNDIWEDEVRNILQKGEVTVSPSCILNLRSYPMDTQICKFKLVSYAHAARDLVYSWKQNPGIKVLDDTMSQFELTGFSSKSEMVGYVAGKYSVLTVSFTFKRLMGHSILQIYIPCVAVVCVSWISLWIDRKSTPARVALCITTLLTVATLWGSANSTLPRVNYIKAVDVYLLTSFVFVLCTLIEYVLVLNCEHIQLRRKKKKNPGKEVEEKLLKPIAEIRDPYEKHSHKRLSTDPPPSKFIVPGQNRKFTLNGNIDKDNVVGEEKKEETVLADYVENFARALFLIVYMVFNCVYWAKYRNSKYNENLN